MQLLRLSANVLSEADRAHGDHLPTEVRTLLRDGVRLLVTAQQVLDAA
jgi:hypothetical protein